MTSYFLQIIMFPDNGCSFSFVSGTLVSCNPFHIQGTMSGSCFPCGISGPFFFDVI